MKFISVGMIVEVLRVVASSGVQGSFEKNCHFPAICGTCESVTPVWIPAFSETCEMNSEENLVTLSNHGIEEVGNELRDLREKVEKLEQKMSDFFESSGKTSGQNASSSEKTQYETTTTSVFEETTRPFINSTAPTTHQALTLSTGSETTQYETTTTSVFEETTRPFINSTAPTTHQALTLSTEVRCFMGLKNGDIPDSALKASSSYDKFHGPQRARLYTTKDGNYRGGWCSYGGARAGSVWIQVDLEEALPVAGILIQGRSDYPQWVKRFKVQCGDSVDSLQYVKINGKEKIFTGNSNQNSVVTQKFPNILSCRFVRIFPTRWFSSGSNTCMRFELIRGSCYDEF